MVSRIFRFHHRLPDLFRQYDQPHAQPRHEYLGKALDINDPVFIVQRFQRHKRLCAVVKIVVIVFLYNVRAVLLRQFQQAAFFFKRIRNARRRLEIRRHINQLRLVELEIILQRGNIHAVLQQRDFNQLAPARKERSRRAVERRLFHKNNITKTQDGF